MDGTYIKVKGVWKYLYRAMDKQGKTVDFLLTAKRDKAAAMRFFDKAMQINGVPAKVTMDKSGAKCVRVGIELMPMIRKGQLMPEDCNEMLFADQFCALAGKIRQVRGTGIRHRQNHVHQRLTR